MIVDSRPTDEEVAALLTQLGETLKGLGADVTKVENWGKRRLAYDTRKQREGTYAVFEVLAEPLDGEGVRASASAERQRPALSQHSGSDPEEGPAGQNSRAPRGGGGHGP